MNRPSHHVGLAIAAAFERAEQHRNLSSRNIQIIMLCEPDGLRIFPIAQVQSMAELQAMQSIGRVWVHWSCLDQTSRELCEIVDQCVADAEAALGVRADA